MTNDTLLDKKLLHLALKALKRKQEEEASLETWYGAETYPHIIREIADRVDPHKAVTENGLDHYAGESDSRFRFVIEKLGEARSTAIHTQVQAVVEAEAQIEAALIDLGLGEDDGIDNDWQEKLADAGAEGEFHLESIADTLNIDDVDALPEFWHAPKILMQRLDDIGSTPTEATYEVHFLLPIVGKRENLDMGEIQLNGGVLVQTEIHDFRILRASAEANNAENLNGESSAEKSFAEADLPNGDNVSYWKYECTATGQADASSQFQEFILPLIGALEYVGTAGDNAHGRLHDFTTTEQRLSDDYSPLWVPPYHIVCTDGSSPAFATMPDTNGRQTLEVTVSELESIIELLNETREDPTLEETWRGAFEAYHDANAARTPDAEYFHLWQALEGLVGTDRGDGSKEVLRRAKGFVRRVSKKDKDASGRETAQYLDESIFDERMNALRDTRNYFVHGGHRTDVFHRDADALRFLFHILMDGLTGLTGDGWNGNKIHGVYQYGLDDEAATKASRLADQLERVKAGDSWSP